MMFFIPHGRRWRWGRPYFDCVDGRRQQVIHELQALAGFVRKHQRMIGLDWKEAMLKGKSFGNYWKHSPARGWWSVFHFVAYVMLECGLIVGSWRPNSLFCKEQTWSTCFLIRCSSWFLPLQRFREEVGVASEVDHHLNNVAIKIIKWHLYWSLGVSWRTSLARDGFFFVFL